MRAFKMNIALTKQSGRESAYSLSMRQQCFASSCEAGSVILEAADRVYCVGPLSLNRYPSPRRSAYSPSRPTTDFRSLLAVYGPDIGYQGQFATDGLAVRANGGATTTKIGLRQCRRNRSSLRQWQYLVWQVALKVTSSAALPVQALASWRPKFLVQTAQVPCWLALPPVCFATTLVSTAVSKQDNRAPQARTSIRNRRWGAAPAAVL